MYQTPGCCGCFGYTTAPTVPQGYGYEQYNQYDPYNQYNQYANPYASQYGNQYGQVGLATSVVAPVNVPPVAPMMPGGPMMNPAVTQADALYQSRTIQAPPIVNKAVINPPASNHTLTKALQESNMCPIR